MTHFKEVINMTQWLLDYRKKSGLTQQEVAEKAGIARTSYASIEQGRRRPSVKKAMRIASVLNFDWAIFFDEKLRVTTQKTRKKKVKT